MEACFYQKVDLVHSKKMKKLRAQFLGEQLEWQLNHKFPVNDDRSINSCSFELVPLRGMDFLKGQMHENLKNFLQFCIIKLAPSI
jgi:hypothetical protein